MGIYTLSEVQANMSPNVAHNTAVPKKVLLVDDIKLFIEVEKAVLEKLDNFHVFTANSGAEALEVMEEERPDIIYMDLYMRGMDGDECCRIIKEKYGKDFPVIMVTHGSCVNDFERCWNAGCDEIIVKPINHPLFIATAKKYLNIQGRTDPRFSARLTIKRGTEQQEVLTDYSVNLSTGGLFLATADIQPIDTQFAIEFSLPDTVSPICCKARVAWTNDPEMMFKQELPAGMGLQFVDISLDNVDAIREYLTADRLVPSW
jgi:uncharacterized protein (TIGR02266 family)